MQCVCGYEREAGATRMQRSWQAEAARAALDTTRRETGGVQADLGGVSIGARRFLARRRVEGNGNVTSCIPRDT
jgi:hypothetical protein